MPRVQVLVSKRTPPLCWLTVCVGIRKHALDKPFDKSLSIEKKMQKAKRRKRESGVGAES
jgi:hypothetical protein